jgi:hypothetical protein
MIIQNSAFDLMRQSIKEQLEIQQSGDRWGRSPFSDIDRLKNDHSGKAGEVFMDKLCEQLNIPKVYDGDIIADDGHYDIIINNKLVEIKTAREGKGGTFQHESLRNTGCDYWVFVDVTPSNIYITAIKSSDWNLKGTDRHPILEIGAHSRHSTTDQFKVDTRVSSSLAKGINAGITLKIDSDTSLEDIRSFLNQHIK